MSQDKNDLFFGAIEAGGTKMICAILDKNAKIIKETSIPTTTPEETVKQMISFFSSNKISSLGIGTFGPVDLHLNSPNYGSILNTPKLAWKNFSYTKSLSCLGCPIAVETDVNASCLGEVTYGSSKGLENVVYITIGTGIGIGVITEGKLLHGMMHPEGGHMILEKSPNDKLECTCPYHKNCLEGLANGPSIKKRAGKEGGELNKDDEVWDLEAEYLSQALYNIILVLQPQRIILGGGVMHQEQLFPLIRQKVKSKINNYLLTKELENMDEYIVPCSLNDKQGILGSFKIGIDKYYNELNKAYK